MTFGTSAPCSPLAEVSRRAPGSVRRTMHVDVGARAAWGAALPMEGVARDLRTAADGKAEVLAAAHVTAGFNTDRELVELVVSPEAPWASELIGVRAGGGFRRRLDSIVPIEESQSLLRQVLDDMPAAMLISGYGFMRLARRQGLVPSSLTPPGVLDRMVDLCSGWRSGGIAALSVGTGEGVPMQDTPPAPVLVGAEGDTLAWHEVGPLRTDFMRRRRCLDVTVEGDGFSIWAMFRDTVGEEDGGESVLHEYAVRARGAAGVIEWIEAEPRVLPFPECPAAAGEVGALVGTPVESLGKAVPELLTEIRSCTHLNDLLRALSGLSGLIAAA
ncbi:MAG: DUF2889 domain-containing protein [Acidimicrobiales bacterium]